jgi:hypothetical protein
MRRVSGRTEPDPAARMPVGAEMVFRTETFPIGSPHGEYTVDNWDHFGGVLLQLHLVDTNTLFVHGSAVLLAPGVAIAARHVIEDFLPQLSEGRAFLSCTSITSYQAMVWLCRKITLVPDTDLALLILSYASEWPPENTFRMASITTRLPKIGEQVSMVGFTAADEEIPFNPIGYSVRGNVRVSVGTITAQHPGGRSFLGPAVEVGSYTSGAMSGGPVFDQHGLLVGIVSRCLVTEDKEGPSYVSLLWPALTMGIEAEWPNGIHTPGRSLLEFDDRLCWIDRRDAIRRTSDTSFEYTHWE